jgi:proton-translocating NADH-quinone oxidoreductase chain N
VLPGLSFYGINTPFFEIFIYYFIILNVMYGFNRFLYTVRSKTVEFPFLLAFFVLNILFLFFITDILLLYFCIELVGFLTYILFGFSYDLRDRYEGVIKYFILNSIASIFILFGISLFYLNVIETSFIQITQAYISTPEFNFLSIIGFISFIVGFIFKLGGFPCLIWIVDIYESLNFSLLNIVLTVHKFAFFCLFIKILFHVFFMFNIIRMPRVLVSAFGSLLIGALGALVQFKLKRFIAYTSINQTGYLFFSLSTGTFTGLTNSFNFIVLYIVSTILFFIVFNHYERNITGLTQFTYLTDISWFRLKINNNYLFIFVFSVMSLANLPPLSTFFAKYVILQELAFISYNYSIIVIILCSFISMYYYLRLLKIFIFDLPTYYINNIKFKNMVALNIFTYFNTVLQLIFIFILTLRFNQIPNYSENLENLKYSKPDYYTNHTLLLFTNTTVLQYILTSLNICTLIFFFIYF